MDAIRSAEKANLTSGVRSHLESQVEIEFDTYDSVEPRVDSYPYSNGQNILRGKLRYEEPQIISGIDPNSEIYDISYRFESDLFIIQDIDSFSRLNQVLSEAGRLFEVTTLKPITYSRLSLWSFVFAGKEQPSIQVYDFENNDLVKFEKIENLSQEELAQDYSLHSANIIFESESGKKVDVLFKNGGLSFLEDSDEDAREYVIQNYEKYVINDQILERLVNR